MTTGSSKSISGELITCVRTQRIVSRSKRFAAARNFSDFKILHAKGLHHAVAGHGFLQDLIQFAELGLAAFHGAPDLPPQLADRPDHQRQKNTAAQSHSPINVEKDGEKGEEGKSLAKNFGEIFGERGARALHVVNDRGHHPSGRLLLEESNRLSNDFCVHFVSQIRQRAQPHKLHQRAAAKLRQRFHREHHQQRNGNDGPYVVNAVRKKVVQV